MAEDSEREPVPLFTYRSPVRRWGLVFVGAGAALLFASILLLAQSIVGAGSGGGAVLAAMCGPLLVAARSRSSSLAAGACSSGRRGPKRPNGGPSSRSKEFILILWYLDLVNRRSGR